MLRQKISLFCCISACVEVFSLVCHHLRRNCWHVPSRMLIASLHACSSPCAQFRSSCGAACLRQRRLLACLRFSVRTAKIRHPLAANYAFRCFACILMPCSFAQGCSRLTHGQKSVPHAALRLAHVRKIPIFEDAINLEAIVIMPTFALEMMASMAFARQAQRSASPLAHHNTCITHKYYILI